MTPDYYRCLDGCTHKITSYEVIPIPGFVSGDDDRTAGILHEWTAGYQEIQGAEAARHIPVKTSQTSPRLGCDSPRRS